MRDLLDRWLPWVAGAGMLVALYCIFIVVPTERDQGVIQRIFYIHVSSAWVAFLGFGTVATASALFLWTGAPRWDQLARSAAEVGVLFCTVVLITGPIWAKPIWGTWWQWDPRLTETLILWAIYAGYLMLRAFGGAEDLVRRWAAVLGIAGVLNIPIIIVSVRLLPGIHPAVLMTREGRTGLVDPLMRLTLAVTGLAFVLVFAWLVHLRTRMQRVAETVAVLRADLAGTPAAR
jgi:heme exporter protein C